MPEPIPAETIDSASDNVDPPECPDPQEEPDDDCCDCSWYGTSSPPRAVWGISEDSLVGVGAHGTIVRLVDGDWRPGPVLGSGHH